MSSRTTIATAFLTLFAVPALCLGHDDPGPCHFDVDGNLRVGASDLVAVVQSWGTCKSCETDLDGDGYVGYEDLMTVLANWGECAPDPEPGPAIDLTFAWDFVPAVAECDSVIATRLQITNDGYDDAVSVCFRAAVSDSDDPYTYPEAGTVSLITGVIGAGETAEFDIDISVPGGIDFGVYYVKAGLSYEHGCIADVAESTDAIQPIMVGCSSD